MYNILGLYIGPKDCGFVHQPQLTFFFLSLFPHLFLFVSFFVLFSHLNKNFKTFHKCCKNYSLTPCYKDYSNFAKVLGENGKYNSKIHA